MKRQSVLLCLLFLAAVLASCEAFSKPLYTVSRDISGQLGSLSTQDLAENIDRLATDPQKTATLLNELAGRDQDEISSLSAKDKEKILGAGVSAILPTSQLGAVVDELTSGGGSFEDVLDALCSGSPDVDTRALETILRDSATLETADATTLTLAAASLVVSAIKKESGAGTVEEKLKKFNEKMSSSNSGSSEKDFKDSLTGAGFSEATASSLAVAMSTTQVLTGMAGAGKPNRKDDLEKLSFGDYNLGDLLDEITGSK